MFTVGLQATMLWDSWTADRRVSEKLDDKEMERGSWVGTRQTARVQMIGGGSGAGEHMGVAGQPFPPSAAQKWLTEQSVVDDGSLAKSLLRGTSQDEY